MSERLGSSKFALQVAIFLQFMLQLMQIVKDIAVFPDNEPFVSQLILQLVAKRIVHSEQQVEQDNPREIRFLYTMITMQCALFFFNINFF